MTYIIITEENIYHEGDERSRKYPGHGYPAWTQTLQVAKEYESYGPFYKEVVELTERKTKFKAFEAKQFSVTTEVNVVVE